MPVEQFITAAFCMINDLIKELFPLPVHGFPIDVVARKRAPRSRVFNGGSRQWLLRFQEKALFGFQGHLLVEARGIPAGFLPYCRQCPL